jgi:hypothetical protein
MRRLALPLLLCVLSACADSQPLAVELRNQAPALQPIHATLYSNVREPRRMLIRDAETWAEVWAEMISAGDPRTPPFVDFTSEDVIVAALGERRSSGFGIAVTGITDDQTTTQVAVTTTIPGPTCDRAEIVTAPLHAVRIRKVEGTLTFDEHAAVRGC